MVSGGFTKEVLEYLKKEGSTNTFKMARAMGLERNMLLNVIGRLEKKEAVKCERGNVIFLKFPAVGPLLKKPAKKAAKTISSPPEQQKIEKVATRKITARTSAQPKALLLLQAENKQLQRKVVQLGETMKELERKASLVPKTITKTVTKTIIKNVPVTKTVIKKVPVIKTVVRRIQALPPNPPRPAETKVWERLKAHSEQFQVSGLELLGHIKLENIKQLREPEFLVFKSNY